MHFNGERKGLFETRYYVCTEDKFTSESSTERNQTEDVSTGILWK